MKFSKLSIALCFMLQACGDPDLEQCLQEQGLSVDGKQNYVGHFFTAEAYVHETGIRGGQTDKIYYIPQTGVLVVKHKARFPESENTTIEKKDWNSNDRATMAAVQSCYAKINQRQTQRRFD